METRPPPTPDGPHLCPRCGTEFDPRQEYCLSCGLRLGSGSGLVARLSRAWIDRFGWYPGDWIWPVLLGLVIAVLGGLAAVIISGSGNSRGAPLLATHPGQPREPVAPTETATVALPTVPRGTPTGSVPQTRTTPPPATKTTAAAGSLTQWPANRNGYTVVLESVPSSTGKSLALERARSASRAGLPQVGIIDSGQYSSLHPGYYVVFSGIYASKSQADSAAQSAAGKGFTSAYSRQITR